MGRHRFLGFLAAARPGRHRFLAWPSARGGGRPTVSRSRFGSIVSEVAYRLREAGVTESAARVLARQPAPIPEDPDRAFDAPESG